MAESAKNETYFFELFLQGEEEGFDYVYSKYFSDLYKYGQYFTKDFELIKDIIQELFIHIWNKRFQLDVIKSLKVYLFSSLRNNLLKALKNREKEESSITNYQIKDTLSRFLEDSKEEEYEFDIIIDHLHKTLQKLDPIKKEALFLKFYNNVDYKDIATILELHSVNHARTIIYRALEEMKKKLAASDLAYSAIFN